MILELKDICKDYLQGKMVIPVLKHIDFQMEQGEYVAIMGPSGSGKTTLMNIVGCLDQATSGQLFLDGQDISKCTENEMSDLRLKKIGFVFQNFQLLSRQTALENVELPLTYAGVAKKERRERALQALTRVGLEDRVNFQPNQLSGGQKQRVAIARALVNRPKILLADEPTGSVDTKTADIIFDIFRELNRNGQTILIVTHDIALSKKVRRVVAIRDGKISSERILKEKYADRLKELTVDWRNEDTQEEYAVIDKAGRVQIPRELWDKLALRDNKVKLELRGDEILLSRPAEDENRNM